MSTAMLTFHSADRMRLRTVVPANGVAELFSPEPGWVWLVAITDGMDQSLTLKSAPASAPIPAVVDNPQDNSCWMFEADGSAIILDNLGDEHAIACFGGTLPEPLAVFAREANPVEKDHLGSLLSALCSGSLMESLNRETLSETKFFDVVRGIATIARRLCFYRAEVNLLTAALAIRSSPNIWRLSSYAWANAQNYSQAIQAAERALDMNPTLGSGPFQAHLDELQSYCDVARELKQMAINRPRTDRKDQRAAYCLHNSQPFAQGGYAMRSHAIAKAVCDQGRDLIALPRPGFPSDSSTVDGHPDQPVLLDGVRYSFENGFGRRGRCYGYIAEAADYFERVFVQEEIGVVHAATNFWTALPAVIAAHRLGLPFVYEVRSFWTITREARSPGFSETPQAQRDDALESITLAMADQVLTLNEQMAQHLVEMGVEGPRISIIPNCVDSKKYAPRSAGTTLAEKFGIKAGDLVIAYMGAMLGYEGIDLLIESAAQLVERHDHIKFLIVGADPEKGSDPRSIEHSLSELIRAHNVQGDVVLVDRVPPAAAIELYHLFDICVYPRRGHEVCELVSPLKPLEAMAAGKMVIGSDVKGLQDMIHHEQTGLTFAKEDRAALTATLERAIMDETLRNSLGRGAMDFVRKDRDWKLAGQMINQVYQRPIEENSSRATRLHNLCDAYFDSPLSEPKDFSLDRKAS